MGGSNKLRWCAGITCVLAMTTLAANASADEIRLKDGKKLYGVIVAYEDNMFKIKTDFGYVLVEKDKIASIIPDTPPDAAGAKAAVKPAAKSEPPAEEKKPAKAATIQNSAASRPEIPVTVAKSDATPPTIKPVSVTPKAPLAGAAAPPPPPKEEPPPIREEVQGNLYINHEYAFR